MNSRRAYGLGCASLSVAAFALWSADAAAQQVVVDLGEVRQVIDGFGASSAFFGQDIPADDAEWLFSEDDGIGLSLHRIRIAPDGTTDELATAQQAASYGSRIWATSWTPPAEWKTNNQLYASPGDGRLEPANYADFANHLADFVEYVAAEGVELAAISPQNEPDWNATWDGCLWSPAEMVTFVRDHLGPTFEERGLTTMIAAPDTAFLRELPSFLQAFEADPEAMDLLGVVATHPYSTEGFGADDLLGVKAAGKPIWQTEISWEAQNAGTPNDTPDSPPSMRTALWMANMLHDHLTELEMNAWNYWAVVHSGEFDLSGTDAQRQNPAFIQGGVRFKRGYAMGNYSKFVRPGYHRVQAQPATEGNVRISAYLDDARIVVVAINAGDAAAERNFTLQGLDAVGAAVEAVPWITSEQLSLEAQAPIAITDSAFSFSLPARSVTSFVIAVDATDPEPPASMDGGVDGAGGAQVSPPSDGGAEPVGAGGHDGGPVDMGPGPEPTGVPTDGVGGTGGAAPAAPAAGGAPAGPSTAEPAPTAAPMAPTTPAGEPSASAPVNPSPQMSGPSPDPSMAPAAGTGGAPVMGAPGLASDANGDDSGCACAAVGRPSPSSTQFSSGLLLALGVLFVARTARQRRD